MYFEGNIRNGRLTMRWWDVIEIGMRCTSVDKEDAGDWVKWKCKTRVANSK